MSTIQTPVPHIPTEQEQRLEELFTYHPPENDEQLWAYASIRQWGLSLAKIICQHTPKGSDQSAAVRKVREAVMTANAAIALKGLNF
jgi:hypothetical protein